MIEIRKMQKSDIIICGDKNQMVGVQASYEMNERIKHSDIYIYQGLGHAAYEEADDFYSRVYSFLVK